MGSTLPDIIVATDDYPDVILDTRGLLWFHRERSAVPLGGYREQPAFPIGGHRNYHAVCVASYWRGRMFLCLTAIVSQKLVTFDSWCHVPLICSHIVARASNRARGGYPLQSREGVSSAVGIMV